MNILKESNDVLLNLINNIKEFNFEGSFLLDHPLLESFIINKWRRVNMLFNIQFLLTFFFVIGVSLFSTMKCGTHNIDEVPLVCILAPFLLEILLFEIFLIYSRQFQHHYLQNFFKLMVFILGKGVKKLTFIFY